MESQQTSEISSHDEASTIDREIGEILAYIEWAKERLKSVHDEAPETQSHAGQAALCFRAIDTMLCLKKDIEVQVENVLRLSALHAEEPYKTNYKTTSK